MQLLVDHQPVEIELKPLEVLRYLLCHAGQAVSKDELVRAVWPGRIISDSALTSTIAKLREAVGPEHGAIRTVHGFGYRFDAAVCADAEISADGQVPLAAGTRVTPTPRRAAALAATTALALLGVVLYRFHPWLPVADADKSVAVLPFANLSAGTGSAYLVDGIHDAVITHLAQVKDLKTISRASVMGFRDAKRSLREVGRALGVAHIVEGSVQRDGQRVRVTAQLIHAESDRHLWAETYDRDIADLFAIQSDVAQRVAMAVHARLSEEERGRIARPPTTSAEAYDLYLRALGFWRGQEVLTEDTIRSAIVLLDRAAQVDPEFAPAYALAARFHILLHWFLRDPRAAEPARQAAERSLALQPDLVEGLIARAHYLDWVVEDDDGALAAYQRARELAPGNAEVLNWMAGPLWQLGRHDEAVALRKQAALLDPANVETLIGYASTLRNLRRYAEAERAYDRALAMNLMPWSMVLEKAFTRFLRTGELSPLEEAFAAASTEHRHTIYLNHKRYLVALLLRDFPGAVRIALEDEDQEMFLTVGRQPISKHVFVAIAFMLGRDPDRAHEAARKGIAFLEPQLAEDPSLPYARLYLAYSRLALDQKDLAIREARRALADWQKARHKAAAFSGLAAPFFAWAGEDEIALELLEHALEAPGGLPVRIVQHDPSYEPLRSDPRFENLIAAHLAEGV